MQIEKPNINTISALKKCGICAGVCLMVSLATLGANHIFKTEIAATVPVRAELDKQNVVTASLESSTTKYKKEFDQLVNKASDNFINRELFVQFVGQKSSEHGVSVNKLAGGNTEINPPVSTMNFKVEIVGATSNIGKFIAEIDNLKVPYMINEISLRKNGDYLWLSRDIDGNKVLEWWNLKDIASPEKNKTPESDNVEPLGVSELFDSQDLSLYFDISFISLDIKGGEK